MAFRRPPPWPGPRNALAVAVLGARTIEEPLSDPEVDFRLGDAGILSPQPLAQHRLREIVEVEWQSQILGGRGPRVGTHDFIVGRGQPPDEPKKVAVDPGEHLVSASTGDGQKWSKVIDVKATGQTVVKVDFGAAVPAAAALPDPKASGIPTGTLLVFADSAIDLEIDGKASGSLSGTPEAPGQRTFMLSPGKHFVKATSKEDAAVGPSADVRIAEGSQEITRVMVADELVARRAERERPKRLKEEIEAAFISIPAGCSPPRPGSSSRSVIPLSGFQGFDQVWKIGRRDFPDDLIVDAEVVVDDDVFHPDD